MRVTEKSVHEHLRTAKGFGDGGIIFTQYFSERKLPDSKALPEGVLSLVADYESTVYRLTENELTVAARAAYESDPNPKKRYYFRPYRVTHTIEVTEEEGKFFCIFRRLTISANKKTIEKLYSEVTDSYGRHIPPWAFTGKKAIRKKLSENKNRKFVLFPCAMKKVSDFYIKNKNIHILTSNEKGANELVVSITIYPNIPIKNAKKNEYKSKNEKRKFQKWEKRLKRPETKTSTPPRGTEQNNNGPKD